MPETDVSIPPLGGTSGDDAAWLAGLEAEVQAERTKIEVEANQLETATEETDRAAAESKTKEPDSADLAQWEALVEKYGPSQVNAAGEVLPPSDGNGPEATPPAFDSETAAPPTAERPPVEAATPAPSPTPASEAPAEPPPTSDAPPPQIEAEPEPSPSSQPVEPVAESTPEASPSTRPVEPAPEAGPSVIGAGAFALGAGAVLAGGAAAFNRPKPPTPPPPLAPPAPAEQSIAQWFYAEAGTTQGPLELNELIARLRAGRIGWETPVWTEGMTGWTAAKSTELSSLAAARPGPPPPPPSAVPPPPPTALGVRSRRFCHHCGAAAESDDRFCTSCGIALRTS